MENLSLEAEFRQVVRERKRELLTDELNTMVENVKGASEAELDEIFQLLRTTVNAQVALARQMFDPAFPNFVLVGGTKLDNVISLLSIYSSNVLYFSEKFSKLV